MMGENTTGNTNTAQKAYVQKLAELSAQVSKMTDEQKEHHAAKIKELNQRVSSLPPDWKRFYVQQLSDFIGVSVSELEKNVRTVSEKAGEAYDNSLQEDDSEEYDDEPPRKRHGCLIAVLVLIVLIAAGIGGCYLWAKNEVSGSRGNEIVIEEIRVEQGNGPRAVGKQLKEAGIIRSANLFYLYIREQDGLAKTLQYGNFELASDMSYDAIIKVLQQTTDERETVRVTFPEGKTAIQYAQIMEQAGLCSAEEFLNVANKTGDFSGFEFWNHRGDNPNVFMKAEGYLFPDTYDFFVGDSVYNMVSKIYGEFDHKITPEMYARMEELDMTLSETITLASLIQEEAGNEYSKQVSAVFHNRLKTGMTLGSNVAWDKEMKDDNNYIYDTMAGSFGFGSWNNIPEEMRAAYDTYSHKGLPAGPVSNPGQLAIEAALWPEENCDYYYFQTDTLGNYHFAKTNAEHEKISADLEKQGIRP